ncbi:MAG: cation diffusion facilitator family transporter [Bacteroidales bacterium]|nr:cation diffusion facilitator family transporter [Bacteroidales bacterium]
MTEAQIKISVQKTILTFSAILLIGKFIAFFLTNSVGILTDAMESIVNVTAGVISLISLYISSKPKDEDHPFGHGKIELISASVEAVLIILAGGLIIYEGLKRVIHPTTIEFNNIGLIIVAAAGLINYLLGWYSIRVGKKHRSMALIAGGKHLQSDTYSSIGLVLGLILLYVTKISWIDSGLAFIFGGVILFTGLGILRNTIENLMDKTDQRVLDLLLETIIRNRKSYWMDIHNLKMIKNGATYYVNCDLTIPWFYTIRQGHVICDEIEEIIFKEMPENINLSVHSDPCKIHQCSGCIMEDCEHRTEPLNKPLEFTIDLITYSSDKSQKFKK